MNIELWAEDTSNCVHREGDEQEVEEEKEEKRGTGMKTEKIFAPPPRYRKTRPQTIQHCANETAFAVRTRDRQSTRSV